MTINETLRCLDADRLDSEEIEDKVFRFVYREMNKAEQEDFQIHLSQCAFCHKKFEEEQQLFNNIKEKAAFDRLNEAYSNKDWQEVIDMAEKLERFRYFETVYPIKSKVNDARLMLGQ